MASSSWKKIENESGYPCYIDQNSGKEQYVHPEFLKIKEAVDEFDGIKYDTYHIAFKIFTLQKHMKVPSLRICSGVFARHQLSMSETSLSLDPLELEAVLTDIYFAAEKEGQFSGNIDLAVDLLINLLLNVYDGARKEPIKVMAAKTLLILLSEESVIDKWVALSNCAADHNGCVSTKRLTALLTHIAALLQYLGHKVKSIQADVDACFEKSGGMLGLTSRGVAEWGSSSCRTTCWLPVVQRIFASRSLSVSNVSCIVCAQPLIQVLKFVCSKCNDTYFCEKCYLFDNDLSKVSGHKKSHTVQEVDREVNPSECLGFINGMRRFFFCTKTKKRSTTKKKSKSEAVDHKPSKKKKGGKPAIFTSTVSKASGHKTDNNPATMLQDIISQLESQNKVLEELSSQLQGMDKESEDVGLKGKVETHWQQISTQINRLKVLKENLTSPNPITSGPTSEKTDRPQAFDLFSPIPNLAEKTSKVTENMNQPRVLSLDSGNFSVTSKHTDNSQNLLTMSGDALKPVAGHATNDSISAVSMNDISHWYNETTSNTLDKTRNIPKQTDLSIQTTEKKYDADIQSMETSNDKMKELNADLDTVLDRLQQILTNNFAMDDSCFDNNQLRETANEMEGLLGTLIRGVEARATLNATRTTSNATRTTLNATRTMV